jgi:amidase
MDASADRDVFWRLDATAQAALVRAGDVSARELLEAAIGRIEALNPRVNAVITRFYDLARVQCEELTGGPFDGVPVLLKDAGVEVEGTPQYLGLRLLRDLGYVSRQTDEMGRRLRRSGFVFLGKTNVPPLSNGATTEPPAFGATRNPWALDRTAGGSSGGSAAAVACGMVPIAHGADATGSLRFPASACGVVTLNPTSGAIPCTTPAEQPDEGGVWRTFVLARSVRDLAGALDALAGPATVDPAPASFGRLRVGLMPDYPDSRLPVEPECARAVEVAGEALEALGHHVDMTFPPALPAFLGTLRQAFGPVVAVARAAQLRWLERTAGRPLTEDDVRELGPGMIEQARAEASVSRAEQQAASEAIRAGLAPVLEWWRTYDVLVTPVMRRVPWPLGEDAGAAHVGAFVQFSSFSGQPSMSLPLHWTPEGLPVGVQVVGTPRADRLLLALAAELEEALPWRDRWPAIALEPDMAGAEATAE